MKNIFIMLILIFAAFQIISCGPTIYKSSNFEKSKSTSKTFAILPFIVSIDSKKLQKGIKMETMKEAEANTGYAMQGNAYKWLLRKQEEYTTTFQDIDKTNALLKKSNITYESILLTEKSEICRILGVDGLISGKVSLSQPMSEAGAIATSFFLRGVVGSTNKSVTSLSIHDLNGNLLWKYDYEAAGSIGSSAESLTDALLKKASKKFPYQKK